MEAFCLAAAVVLAALYRRSSDDLVTVPPATEAEVATWGGFTFWRTRGSSLASPRPHVVSTVVFRSDAGYSESHKYANYLKVLCQAVATHLPAFTLRVYADVSVRGDVLQRCLERGSMRGPSGPLTAAQAQATLRAWAECFAALEASGCAEVVWFEHSQFRDPAGGGGHVGMFSTIARFIPLFEIDQLPPWCGSPQPGAVVMVADVDYHDYECEHLALHLAAWLSEARPVPASQLQHSQLGAVPELLCLTPGVVSGSGASSLLRHAPTCGMPPMIANCILTTARFPQAWLTDYLADMGRGRQSVLHGRFLEGMSSSTSEPDRRRNVHLQQQCPYGTDEFLLTQVLKTRAATRPEARLWMFLISPEYALLVSRALALTRSAKSTSPVHPAVLRLGTAAAACAGVAPPSPGTPPSQYGKTQQPAAAAGATAPQRRVYNVTSWSELATRRYGKRFEAFAGLCWPALCAAPSAPLSAELLELCSASLDAMASGAVGHTAADLEFWCSALQVAASCAPRVMAPLNWAVGGGQWQALGAAGPQATLLMEALESSMGNSCGVVPPKPDTALPV